MSNVRISQLNDFNVIKAEDFIPLVDSSSMTTYRSDVQSLSDWFGDSGSVSSASFASQSLTSVSSSWASASINSISASFLVYPNTATSSFSITASFANAGLSASYAKSASNANTASFSNNGLTASYAKSSSVADTASYFNFSLPSTTPPFASSSLSSSWASSSLSSSYAMSASNADTASLALTASYVTGTTIATNVGKSYHVANTGTAFSTGSILYVYNFNRFTSRRNLVKINMDTNVATYQKQWPRDAWNLFGKIFKASDNSFRIIANSDDGLYDYNLTTDTTPQRYYTGGTSFKNPVYVDWTDIAHPTVWCLEAGYNSSANGTTPVFRRVKIYWTGAAWTIDTNPAPTGDLDIRSINNATDLMKFYNSATAQTATANTTMMFDYNYVKKRYYIMDAGTGYLHIISYTGVGDGITTGWGTNSNFTYEKTLALPIPALDQAGDGNAEKYVIQYDINTGEETGIVTSRRGNTSLLSTVSFVSWPEL